MKIMPIDWLERSDVLEFCDRPFVRDISRVQSRFWLNQHDVDFLVRDGAMLYAARHDDEFTRADSLLAIAKFHSQRAMHHEKELVLVIVMMPDELALDFCNLYVRIVELANHARLPMIRKEAEFLL